MTKRHAILLYLLGKNNDPKIYDDVKIGTINQYFTLHNKIKQNAKPTPKILQKYFIKAQILYICLQRTIICAAKMLTILTKILFLLTFVHNHRTESSLNKETSSNNKWDVAGVEDERCL